MYIVLLFCDCQSLNSISSYELYVIKVVSSFDNIYLDDHSESGDSMGHVTIFVM